MLQTSCTEGVCLIYPDYLKDSIASHLYYRLRTITSLAANSAFVVVGFDITIGHNGINTGIYYSFWVITKTQLVQFWIDFFFRNDV